MKQLKKNYGMFLIPNEKVDMAFTLVRDLIVFTDKRLIFSR